MSRPNILLIVSDQERHRSWLPTDVDLPNRERLIAGGTSFERHYTNTSPCSPSRASLFTGRYAAGHGVNENSTGPESTQLSFSIPTLGHRLREHGYPVAQVPAHSQQDHYWRKPATHKRTGGHSTIHTRRIHCTTLADYHRDPSTQQCRWWPSDAGTPPFPAGDGVVGREGSCLARLAHAASAFRSASPGWPRQSSFAGRSRATPHRVHGRIRSS